MSDRQRKSVYQFDYANESLRKIFCDPDNYCDSEAQEELKPFLKALKEKGVVSGAKTTPYPLVNGWVREISGRTFEISYIVFPKQRVIKFIKFSRKKLLKPNEWVRYMKEKVEQELKEFAIVPTTSPIVKLIELLELIHRGVVTSYEIGKQLGYTGTSHRYIARHGQYCLEAGEALNLLKRIRRGRSNYPELTELGQRIAMLGNEIDENGNIVKKSGLVDRDTQARLLAEAMFKCHPMRVIIQAITEEKEYLEIDIIQNLIESKIKPRYYQKSTSYRKAQCLMTWALWLTSIAGISVYRRESEASQLCLKLFPNINYSTEENQLTL